MKKSLELYEELKDTFRYICSSWLRYKTTPGTDEESTVILCAASFLFDNLFAQENAGAELTKEAAADLGSAFNPKNLAEMATKLRLAMTDNDPEHGGSPVRDYLKWVQEAKPMVMDSLKDRYGLLTIAVADEIATLLVEQDKDAVPLQTAEICFLVFTQTFYRNFLELYGKDFLKNPSAAYFLDVDEEMERINATLTN